jgi:phosphoenolpyruvate-protein phosphotransferase
MMLSGVGVSSGRACAPLVVLRATDAPAHPAGPLTDTGRDGTGRLDEAVAVAQLELDAVIELARTRVGDEHAAIFGVQRALLDDPEWIGEVRSRVAAGDDPEAAVAHVSEDVAEMIAALPDEYLSARAADIRDLGQRVVRLLRGAPQPLADLAGETAVVIAAHDLTPTDALALDPDVVKAVVTEAGARTSHTSIVMRQLGIPAVVSVTGLLDQARDGMIVAIDGDAGTCELEPTDAVVRSFAPAPGHRSRLTRLEAAVTLDGTVVHVLANAASPADVRRAVAQGADGIGLYRTEFLFLGSDALPDEAEQARVYAEAAHAADGRPIIFRTLDIGGDKHLPLLGLDIEANPFLGVRGVRFSLSRTDLFEVQLRALLRTAEQHANLRVMLPMITSVEELEQVEELVLTLGDVSAVALGVMIEVPAAATMADAIARRAAFLSVGTNDLTQYLLAVDRTNDTLVHLYNELHPAVLRMLASIAVDALREDTPVGICGELAGRAEVVPLLVGLGYRHLSVSPPRVQDVKDAVSRMTLEDALALAERAVACSRASSVEELLGLSAGIRPTDG